MTQTAQASHSVSRDILAPHERMLVNEWRIAERLNNYQHWRDLVVQINGASDYARYLEHYDVAFELCAAGSLALYRSFDAPLFIYQKSEVA